MINISSLNKRLAFAVAFQLVSLKTSSKQFLLQIYIWKLIFLYYS